MYVTVTLPPKPDWKSQTGNIHVSFYFSVTKDAQDFIYLTKVILNKINFPFLVLRISAGY